MGYDLIDRGTPNCSDRALCAVHDLPCGRPPVMFPEGPLSVKVLGARSECHPSAGLADPAPETPPVVAASIRAALKHLPPARLIPAPRSRHEIHPSVNSLSPSSRHWPRVPLSSP